MTANGLVARRANRRARCGGLGTDARADQRLDADNLKEKLIKIGAKVVSHGHGRYVAFQMENARRGLTNHGNGPDIMPYSRHG
jgi:hypothetical protein